MLKTSMQNNLYCVIEIAAESDHLKQIYTGFSLLERCGFLRVKQEFPSLTAFDYDIQTIVKVRFNDKCNVIYDVHDSSRIDKNLLKSSDFYFKRSYSSHEHNGFVGSEKIFPLGLNYAVSTNYVDFKKLQRSRLFHGFQRIRSIAKSLRLDRLSIVPAEAICLDKLESLPDLLAPSKVLYMTRVWDPDQLPDRTQRLKTIEMNEQRVECLRILSSKLGDSFLGGLSVDDYSIKTYPEYLLENEYMSLKRNYLNTLKGYPICIATSGLFGSNGWKLAEYVAFSKAIVTEPLIYELPGNFSEGVNYLSFTNTNDLVDKVLFLCESTKFRNKLMMANHKYYLSYGRPDSMILNTIASIVEELD